MESRITVIGIDTHACTHTYAIINTTTGAHAGCEAFPVTSAGMSRAIAWIRRNTGGAILAAVEGTSSYGSSIRRALHAEDVAVVEVKPPKKPARAGVGKTDQIDAAAAAMSVLGRDTANLLQPRDDGERTAISVLLDARGRVEQQRTANHNALNALVRQLELGIDARRALKALQSQLADLGEQLAPGLQSQPGFGPVTVGIILATYSHSGRIRSEAAFAALAGAAPLQASSGNTIRHRLNRNGDRQLNMALDVIAKVRMRFHEQTKA
ncbi:IS110 family transposase [Nesterenkonia alkaliphila]|nr:IS110 family transposase [Nesterenkonia alkaliphila]